MHNRHRLAVPAALAALSLALTACGSKTADTTAPDTAGTTAATPAPATDPLTGLPMSDPAQTHPVYIVKVDNTEASDPQIGLGSADLVTEELVEGGLCRLATFFYDKLPEKVGPVRSMRLTDIGIAKPVGATIITSGAAPLTLRGLHKAGITFLDMNNPNVVRVSDGQHDSLHSVMANVAKIASEAKQDAARPNDYLPFGDQALPSGKKATSIVSRVGGSCTDRWSYEGGHYVLTNGFMAKGDEFNPDTVITATVKTSTAHYRDPAGNPVPISHFEGSGDAMIFHGGEMVKATWEKADTGSAVTFKDAQGNVLQIPAGHTWLELVPGKGTFSSGSVTFTK
ncbi:DUF3048 domain-containing protein [Nocardioides ultimimeridianus]